MRDPIGAVLDTVDELSMWGAWLAAFCILSILGLIVAEVLARNLFNYSLYFAWEFSAYLMGAAFLLGAAYALLAGAQIRVNVLLENVPRPVSRFFDLFGTVCGVLIAAYLTYALGELTWLSYVRDSRSPENCCAGSCSSPCSWAPCNSPCRPWPGWHGCCAASRVTTSVCVSARTSNNS